MLFRSDTKVRNQHKLFYLMSRCLGLVKEYEQKRGCKYRKILKIRPDKVIQENFHFSHNDNSLLFNNLDYFGCGDQTIFGDRDVMNFAMSFYDFYAESTNEFFRLTEDSCINNHASFTKYLWSSGVVLKKIGGKSNGPLLDFSIPKEWFYEKGILTDLDCILNAKEKSNILKRTFLGDLKFVAYKLASKNPDLSDHLLDVATELYPKAKGAKKLKNVIGSYR